MFWLFMLSLPEDGMALFKSRNMTFSGEILQYTNRKLLSHVFYNIVM